MTPRQCDKLIEGGRAVLLYDTHFQQNLKHPVVIVSRDRYSLKTACGGVYDRADLVEVEQPRPAWPFPQRRN